MVDLVINLRRPSSRYINRTVCTYLLVIGENLELKRQREVKYKKVDEPEDNDKLKSLLLSVLIIEMADGADSF